MDKPSNLRAHLFDLADQDREAIRRIRERLCLTSSALAVRLAIRELARRLDDPHSGLERVEPSQESK